MTLIIRPEAIRELLSAARWYEERQAGLGDSLIERAQAAMDRVRESPRSFGRYEFYRGTHEVRRASFDRFPFGVVNLVEPTQLVVLAFAPDRRRPLYWVDRLAE